MAPIIAQYYEKGSSAYRKQEYVSLEKVNIWKNDLDFINLISIQDYDQVSQVYNKKKTWKRPIRGDIYFLSIAEM